jgi:acyl-CoA synthetase (AMP-forming)/AMP-acid ligase II
VAEAAVVAMSDAHWGAVPAAFAVRRAGAGVTEDDLVQFCRAQLAAYKCPRRVIAVDALPRTASGKALRRTLRDRLRTLVDRATDDA